MNLYEKVLTTEPGKHAHEIGDVLYENSMCEDAVRRLTIVRTYLESLAIAEIKRQADQWVLELAEWKEKP